MSTDKSPVGPTTPNTTPSKNVSPWPVNQMDRPSPANALLILLCFGCMGGRDEALRIGSTFHPIAHGPCDVDGMEDLSETLCSANLHAFRSSNLPLHHVTTKDGIIIDGAMMQMTPDFHPGESDLGLYSCSVRPIHHQVASSVTHGSTNIICSIDLRR
jgi:hypothetical protein